MRLGFHSVAAAVGLGFVVLLAPFALAQDTAGVVTTLVGSVTVLGDDETGRPLKFGDSIFVNDRITTGEKSIARILLGGKGLVTMREHSIIEFPAADGSRVDVSHGCVAVAVAGDKMKTGAVVEVRTPHAATFIRSVITYEVSNAVSWITVLKGVMFLMPLDGGQAVGGRPMIVNAGEQVSVVGAAAVSVEAIWADYAHRLGAAFRIAPPHTEQPSTDQPRGDRECPVPRRAMNERHP